MGLLTIGLVGDHDPAVLAHEAIPRALALAAASLAANVQAEWIGTERVGADPGTTVAHCAGLWCVPGSPYRNTAGALAAIRYARERGVPFLGTCGGFQHALVEYAQNVLGIADAAHAELDPDAPDPLIAPLACALVEQQGTIRLAAGSRAQRLCGTEELVEGYHCSFGLNPTHEAALTAGGLLFTGRDPAGEVRIAELPSHPFWLATLFQPERAALRGEAHPLIRGFVAAVAGHAGLRRDAPSGAEP
jgi:CTP synthase (UTP-ammonia lyase)